MDPAWRNAYSLACLLRALVMLSGACAAQPAQSSRLCSGAAHNCQQSRGVSRQGPPQGNAQCVRNTAHGSSQPEHIAAQPAGVRTEQHQGALSVGCMDCLGMPAGALLSAAACSPADPPASVHACCSEKQTSCGQAARAQLMLDGGSSGAPEAEAIEAAMRELDMGLMMGGAALAGSLHAAMAIAEDAWSRSASSCLPDDSHCEQPQQSRRNKRWRQGQLQQDSKRKREESGGGPEGSLCREIARNEACLHQNGPSEASAGCSRDEWRGTAVWPHDVSKLKEERQQSVPPGAQGCSAAVIICCCITWTQMDTMSTLRMLSSEHLQLCALGWVSFCRLLEGRACAARAPAISGPLSGGVHGGQKLWTALSHHR